MEDQLIKGKIILHQTDLDILRRVVTRGWILSKSSLAREVIEDVLSQFGQPVTDEEKDWGRN